MKSIVEYCGQISLNEYLSTKNVRKPLSNEECIEQYINDLAKEVFNEDAKGARKVTEEMMKFMSKNKKFDTYRVYSNFKEGDDFIMKNKTSVVAKPFEALIEEDTIAYDVIEDITTTFSDYKFETDEREYYIYYANMGYYLMENASENGIMFELIDDYIKNVNFTINKYHYRSTTYIELSHRPIIAELDNVPYENDNFWANYNEFVEDYKNLAIEKTGLEFYVLGGQGKHVCVKPSFQLFHCYDSILDTVNDLQEKLKKDAQDEVDYQNDPENH